MVCAHECTASGGKPNLLTVHNCTLLLCLPYDSTCLVLTKAQVSAWRVQLCVCLDWPNICTCVQQCILSERVCLRVQCGMCSRMHRFWRETKSVNFAQLHSITVSAVGFHLYSAHQCTTSCSIFLFRLAQMCLFVH